MIGPRLRLGPLTLRPLRRFKSSDRISTRTSHRTTGATHATAAYGLSSGGGLVRRLDRPVPRYLFRTPAST